MMEDLAMAVSGDGDESALATLNYGFPTSGLAVVRFPGSLADAAPGTGHLEAFLTPADL
jgi:phosphohistidine phosphatase